MKQCNNCKSEIKEDAKFCTICGQQQSPMVQSTTIQNAYQNNPNAMNQKVPSWVLILIVILFVGAIFLSINSSSFSSDSEKEDEISKYNTNKLYSVGETLKCPSFEITVNSVQIKVKGTYFSSYEYVNDPEWIGVTVTVKNISNMTKRFYTSDFGLINSNGEVINTDVFFYNVWGEEKFDSPELTSGGNKRGFVVFTNTNQDNSNLKLTVDCNTGLFEKDIVYNVNISQ